MKENKTCEEYVLTELEEKKRGEKRLFRFRKSLEKVIFEIS